ncbi:MAG: hypothetical protein AAFN74_01580 [Myxococcota bacterium]
MRIFVVSIGLIVAMLSGASRAHATGSNPAVEVEIQVVLASREAGKIDEKLQKHQKLMKQLKTAGFQSAQLSDELTASVQVGSQVSLEAKTKPEPRMLKVKVKEVTKEKEISLHVAIEALKFKIDTQHKNGGTIVLAHRQDEKTALFLAVTPKL